VLHIQVIEGLWDKLLDCLKPLDHKSEGRKLAWTIADLVVTEDMREGLLKVEGLEAGEGGANAQIHLHPNLHSVDLASIHRC